MSVHVINIKWLLYIPVPENYTVLGMDLDRIIFTQKLLDPIERCTYNMP